MVCTAINQLGTYHADSSTFMTTNQHFHDNPNLKEGGGRHSTRGLLYGGSLFFTSQAAGLSTKRGSRTDGSIKSMADLDKAPPPRQATLTRTQPAHAYRGTGAFVVELPHSTITYKSLNMVPASQMTAWRSEYGAQYKKKSPYTGGYSTLKGSSTAGSWKI